MNSLKTRRAVVSWIIVTAGTATCSYALLIVYRAITA